MHVIDNLGKPLAETVSAEPDPHRTKIKQVPIKFERIDPCRHKYDPSRQPSHRNCKHCWTRLFADSEAVRASAHDRYINDGPIGLMHNQGRTFLKAFERYMEEVVYAESEASAPQPAD